MISAQQLKDKIKNIAKGDSMKAQLLLRNYMMERFLARVSLSDYKDNFILKGGMLVSAVVGIQARATMDIDTTVRALPLQVDETKSIVEKIISIDAGDGVTFEIKKISDIMEEHDYPGIRIVLDAKLENLTQAIKVDMTWKAMLCLGHPPAAWVSVAPVSPPPLQLRLLPRLPLRLPSTAVV